MADAENENQDALEAKKEAERSVYPSHQIIRDFFGWFMTR